MKNNLIKTLLFFSILSSYSFFPAQNNEYYKLQKLELQILKKNIVGKSYKFDLTRKKGCNKTELKLLGIVTTKSGKKY